MISLSVVVLCYRAERAALDVVAPLYESLRAHGDSFELVLVANFDADRPDGTADALRPYAQGRPEIVVLSEPKLGGMGWDMRAGLEATSGDYVVVMDGDGQNPIEDVLRCYAELRTTGADIVKGRRRQREDGLKRRTISVVYNVAFRLMFGSRGLWDINGKPKAFTRAALARLAMRSDDWFIDAELMLGALRAGMTIREVPVDFRRIETRASFVRLGAVSEFARHMVRERLSRRA